jgi:hypothetical protein
MTDVVKNRAIAFKNEDGRWKLDMNLGNDRGGGGPLTAPTDPRIWNYALTNNRLGAFVTEKLQAHGKDKLPHSPALLGPMHPSPRFHHVAYMGTAEFKRRSTISGARPFPGHWWPRTAG